MTLPTLLTKQDLARRWQVSLRTVQRWTRRWLPAVAIDAGSKRWRLSDVLAFEQVHVSRIVYPPSPAEVLQAAHERRALAACIPGAAPGAAGSPAASPGAGAAPGRRHRAKRPPNGGRQ